MRAFATTVHRWAGLAVALFLIVSGLTGAVISWDHEIDGWLNSELYDTDSRGPFRDPFELAIEPAVDLVVPRDDGAGQARDNQEQCNREPREAVHCGPEGAHQKSMVPLTAKVRGAPRTR